MTRLLLSLMLALLAWPLTVTAQNERAPEVPELAVEIVTAMATDSSIFVQQQVLVRISLVSRHPFRTLQVDMPVIAGAEVHTASRARTREFATYGGSGWRHQRVLALFPTASGTLQVPPVRASGSVERPDGTVIAFSSESTARMLEVLPAHRYLNGFWWVAAESLTLEEAWSREIASLRIGDTVRRTVTMVAKGVTADRLPELVQPITPGARIVAAGEERRTRFAPDGATAEVTRSWDITVDSDSPVNVPPVSVTWWNTVESRPASTGVSAARIEPLAIDAEKLRAALMAEAAADRSRDRLVLYLLAALVLLPVSLLLVAILLALAPRPADLRLRRDLRRGGDIAQARAVVTWARATVVPDARTLRDVAAVAPRPVRPVLSDMERGAYGGAGGAAADAGILTRWSRQWRLRGVRHRIVGLLLSVAGAGARRQVPDRG